jgi:hypothetical protein
MPRHRVGAKRGPMTGSSGASSAPGFRDNSWRHGILDHSVELVIGLAGGETRWRMMTLILTPFDE